MPCPNNAAWCPGPAGSGRKCLKCERGTGTVLPSTLPGQPARLGAPAPVVPERVKPPVPIKPPKLVAKPALGEAASEVAAAAPGGYKFYRGDTRPPQELRNGFTAWASLSAEQARTLLKRFMGTRDSVDLPRQAKGLQDAINGSNAAMSLIDLVRQVKIEKNRSTVHISTDLTEECGGYADGYIYEMTFPSLNTLTTRNVLTSNPPSLECTSPINPLVVLDGDTIDASQTLAISSRGDEVSFLTPIPYACITRYKAPRSSVWQAMPT
ncbi:hypothetical protein [Caldimonas brevitalea]|uniref:Uncharacterized protein n=1 Tax=Caldimonas brevitalea TaxID=413882 RepID=A0A0G3BZM7_9BURK|nr:hypothetical protein [Caldimonas brevitalea]AKJ31995.1 hypothetical protein AAW51_5304 [Caldimonas brevitalea]